jgi:hypothetical protein
MIRIPKAIIPFDILKSSDFFLYPDNEAGLFSEGNNFQRSEE